MSSLMWMGIPASGFRATFTQCWRNEHFHWPEGICKDVAIYHNSAIMMEREGALGFM